jgi:ABC-2 type transport system ATP-binding protein
LDTWNLAGLRRSSFASLSGGQRQRLFIALALLNEPRVVFFDELTQGLDPLARSDVWGAIRDVRDRGTTVVLVTHFMDEAEALCDRVAVMRAGRVLDAGTPADLIARHARLTTVTFTPPVSFDPAALAALPGVDGVERHGERIRVSGTNQLIAPVCSAVLGDDHLGPPDLRVHHPDLEPKGSAYPSPRSRSSGASLSGWLSTTRAVARSTPPGPQIAPRHYAWPPQCHPAG